LGSAPSNEVTCVAERRTPGRFLLMRARRPLSHSRFSSAPMEFRRPAYRRTRRRPNAASERNSPDERWLCVRVRAIFPGPATDRFAGPNGIGGSVQDKLGGREYFGTMIRAILIGALLGGG
jgi:hypothetical protein